MFEQTLIFIDDHGSLEHVHTITEKTYNVYEIA